MRVELTPDEIELLLDTIKETLGTIREEVHHADDHSVAAELKREEALAKSIVAKLSSASSKAGMQAD